MSDYWSYYQNKEFNDKVKYEMQKAAIAVMAEDAGTANHTERVTYANKILTGEASIKEMCIGVLTNATVKGHVMGDTDYTSDLAYTVQSLYDAFAGIATTA